MLERWMARPRWPAIAAAVLAAGLARNAQADDATLDRIRADAAIVIGYRTSLVPLSYLAGSTPVGYSIDVCQRVAAALAKELGLKSLATTYREVTSANRLAAVQSGQVDLECGSTTNNAERRKLVAFTVPHFIASSRLLVRTADGFDKIEDLDGHRVASTAGTTNVASLKREADLKGVKLEVPEAHDHPEAVRWLLKRQVDAFAMDDVLLFGLRAGAPDPSLLKVVGKPMTIEPYSIVFAKDQPHLKRVVDATLRQLIGSGELRRLYDRWFTRPIPPKGVNLEMPASTLLTDSWRYPSDYVPN